MSLREAQQAFLREHNRLRALHQNTEPLMLSQSLCDDAQAWADRLMSQGLFEHQPRGERNQGAGENIAWSEGWSPTMVAEAVRATKQQWYDEIQNPGYDFNNPGWQNGAGHFTQVVWRDTKQLGLGIAQRGQKFIVVGRYWPAGNMSMPGYNNYERNIARLK